jgi:hypothetical protein
MKKKVRYAAGALGALGVVPALGLAALPAGAATHATAGTGKTVRTVAPDLANAPAAPCHAHHRQTIANSFVGYITFSADIGCVNYVQGIAEYGGDSNATMRIKFYADGNQTGPTVYIPPPGTPSPRPWSYYPPHQNGVGKVCEALVSTYHLSDVLLGPACESTGYTG